MCSYECIVYICVSTIIMFLRPCQRIGCFYGILSKCIGYLQTSRVDPCHAINKVTVVAAISECTRASRTPLTVTSTYHSSCVVFCCRLPGVQHVTTAAVLWWENANSSPGPLNHCFASVGPLRQANVIWCDEAVPAAGQCNSV